MKFKNLSLPDPIAPMISAIMVNIPIQIPPNEAAIGIYLLSIVSMLESL